VPTFPFVGAVHTVRYASVPLWPRLLNIVLGAWLFASTFLWGHQGNIGLNDWMIGLLASAAALSAVWAPALRWVNTFLGAWLGFWALLLEYSSPITRLHDLAVAGLIIAVSLVPGEVPELLPA
jgi:hypothetical protein